jgi:hypothetical protein
MNYNLTNALSYLNSNTNRTDGCGYNPEIGIISSYQYNIENNCTGKPLDPTITSIALTSFVLSNIPGYSLVQSAGYWAISKIIPTYALNAAHGLVSYSMLTSAVYPIVTATVSFLENNQHKPSLFNLFLNNDTKFYFDQAYSYSIKAIDLMKPVAVAIDIAEGFIYHNIEKATLGGASLLETTIDDLASLKTNAITKYNSLFKATENQEDTHISPEDLAQLALNDLDISLDRIIDCSAITNTVKEINEFAQQKLSEFQPKIDQLFHFGEAFITDVVENFGEIANSLYNLEYDNPVGESTCDHDLELC